MVDIVIFNSSTIIDSKSSSEFISIFCLFLLSQLAVTLAMEQFDVFIWILFIFIGDLNWSVIISLIFFEDILSEAYNDAINIGKHFMIEDENSQICKHGCVSYRTISKPIKNLETYFNDKY